MTERIQFARATDGVLIAYRDRGLGRPLVLAPAWVSHLELDTKIPHLRRFEDMMTRGGHRRILQFDARGCGLSDRKVSDFSAEARARDIEAVVDAAGLDHVTLFTWSINSPAGVVYAATHPKRVKRLIIYAGFAHYTATRPALGRALVDLIRAEWSLGSRAVVDFIAPDTDKPTVDAFAAYQTAAASGETAAALLEEALFKADVRAQAESLTMPTLVLHRRDDPAVSFECGRELARLIPNAELVALQGDEHTPWQGDTKSILDAIATFLGDTEAEAVPSEPTAGLQIIFFSDMTGSTELTSRLGDARAQEVLRTHDTVIRDALRHNGGTEIKHTGDGIMARFPSASGAIDCALAVQKAFAQHNQQQEGEPIRVRIGLNAGEPVADGLDLFGSAVQAAARITDYARPGQILVADVVRQLAEGKGYVFQNRGKVALKGFPHRFRLFEVEAAPEGADPGARLGRRRLRSGSPA
jgi:class 3 adenylate cyclase